MIFHTYRCQILGTSQNQVFDQKISKQKSDPSYQKALTFLFLGVRGSYLESELILAETFISDAFQTFLWRIWSKFQARYLSFHDNSVSIFSYWIRGLSGPEIFLKSIWKTPEMNVSALVRSLSKYELLTLKNKKVTTFWLGSLFFSNLFQFWRPQDFVLKLRTVYD